MWNVTQEGGLARDFDRQLRCESATITPLLYHTVETNIISYKNRSDLDGTLIYQHFQLSPWIPLCNQCL